MLTSSSLSTIREQVLELVAAEQALLQRLQQHAAQLRSQISRIQPRPVTSVSLVGTDSANEKVQYDPLVLDVIRVVDSSGREFLLEAVTANLSVEELDARQFAASGEPLTPLGRLMNYLGERTLKRISRVFDEQDDGKARSSSWVREYRGLHEWAALFELVRETNFGTDTIIVREGPFREKMFRAGVFRRIRQGIAEGLEHQLVNNKRRLYLAGLLNRNKVLQKYRLALALEKTFHTRYPCFAPIPIEMLKESVKYPEWFENANGAEDFVGGIMFAAKFGAGPYDPVWMVDIFESQVNEVARIMGFLLNDSLDGFPTPCYPACLQKAREAAELGDFDLDILEQMIHGSLRASLGERGDLIDKLNIQESDSGIGRAL